MASEKSGFSSDRAQALLAEQLSHLEQLKRIVPNLKKKGRAAFTLPLLEAVRSRLREGQALVLKRHGELTTCFDPREKAVLPYFKEDILLEVSDELYEAEDFLSLQIDALQPETPPVATAIEATDPGARQSRIKLPELQIPRFRGDFREWEHFASLFTSAVINNRTLTDAERLQYLNTCVDGEPAAVISRLSISNENFSTAWEALEHKYNNRRVLTAAYLKELFGLSTIHREKLESLRQVTERVPLTLSSLHKMGCNVDAWDPLLVYLITSKFSSELDLEWEDTLGASKEYPTFEQLNDFVSAKMNSLLTRQEKRERPATSSAQPSTGKYKVRAHAAGVESPPIPVKREVRSEMPAATASGRKCPCCRNRHPLYQCLRFKEMDLQDRVTLVCREHLCSNCLFGQHSVDQCPSRQRCFDCSGMHHTLLHLKSESRRRPSPPPRSSGPSRKGSSDKKKSGGPTPLPQTSSHSCATTAPEQAAASSPKTVMLATALVRVHGASGREQLARALIDMGSQASFITGDLANTLRLPRTKKPVGISGLGGGQTSSAKYCVDFEISRREGNSQRYAVKAYVVRKLTDYVPPPAKVPAPPEFRGLVFADPHPTSDAPIDLLIGADLYGRLLSEGLRKSKNGPTAHNTVLGWILTGPVSEVSAARSRVCVNHCTTDSLEAAIRRFWEVEELPTSPALTEAERECEDLYRRTVKRDRTGRFVVRLPFRESPQEKLGDSFRIARAAYSRLERKLHKEPSTCKEYEAFMQEYIELGHMSMFSDEEQGRTFIPHRAVVRADSLTTKLRVVFNATSVTASGRSLNDVLHVGPKLQKDITSILLNWRLEKYVLAADIEKMFRQILVDKQDRRYQCILWRDPDEDKIATYELNTVTYGTSCAPYLAMRTLRELTAREGSNFPLAVPVLDDAVYVDDVFIGGPSKKQVDRIRVQVTELLARGGFNLRKWAGNNKELLTEIPRAEHSHAVDLTLFDESELKVLGIRWIPAGDYFHFNLEQFQGSMTRLSKRALFSEIAKLFDPLGWLSPVLIRAKILMQAQWLEKLGWDSPVSDATQETWNLFCRDWRKLPSLQIPRWVRYRPDTTSVELHGFCDASLSAYSAVVYLRVTHARSEVTSSLLMAKTRVAPIKTQTIPVLELNGAVLLTTLMNHIRGSLRIKVDRIVCWTDSAIVLAWLRKHPSYWKVAVSNRVSKIQSCLPEANWRHVRTRDNPADLNSRGVRAEDLLRSDLWMQGPTWLRQAEKDWPEQPRTTDTEEERRAVHAHKSSVVEQWNFLFRYSRWSRLVRVTAYCVKFYAVLRAGRRPAEERGLTAADLWDATLRIARYLQRTHFASTLEALERNRQIPSSSPLLRLNPFLDGHGVLRVGGRLRHSVLAWDNKHPIILPSHYVSTLILRQCHVNSLHGGVQLTMRLVQERYWILRARSTLRTVVNNCVRCTRAKARTSMQLMQDLLPDRCRPARAFSTVGVDYAGPYLVRDQAGRGKTAHKAYIAVFVCYATRAIHIELVHDYSTPAFLAAFDRFIARRGTPSVVRSDNGTNFVGASRELDKNFTAAFKSSEMRDRCADRGIKWLFNPPGAPHFGGMQEAGVKSIKQHLRRIIGEFKPTAEEMTTLLCKVEASLNSRPLSPLSDDPADYDALTPGHFLIGAPLRAPPVPSVENENLNRLSRWRAIQKFHEQLWRRWSREYLQTLQNRYKWQTAQPQLKIGDLVLVENTLLPPQQWELARVEDVFPGTDGKVRVVKVKTQKSTYTRPITRLCKLPIDEV